MRRREKLKQPSCTWHHVHKVVEFDEIASIANLVASIANSVASIATLVASIANLYSREYHQFSREYRQFSHEYRQFSRELRRLRSLSTSSVLNKLTRVRRQRQNDCFQYNNINLIAQKKYLIKSLTVVYTPSKRCRPRQNAYFHVFHNTLACQAACQAVFSSKVNENFSKR